MMKARKPTRYMQKPHMNNPRLQQLQQQQLAQQQGKIGSNGQGITVHDEAEVMNFRHFTAARFIQNQELLETVLEKNVPLKSIVGPEMYPDSKLYQAENVSGSIWIGNLAKVKALVDENAREIEELEKNKPVLDKTYMERQEMFRKLTRETGADLEEMDKKIVEIVGSYPTVVNEKKTIQESRYIKKSNTKLKPADYTEAPNGWYERQQQVKLEIEKQKEEEMKRKREEEHRRQLQYEKEQKEEQEKLFRQQQQQQQQQQQALSQPVVNPAQPVMEQQSQMPVMVGGDSMGFNYDTNGDLNLATNDVFSGDIPGFMDDEGFGIHSALDDNDFLSQIDHSME